MQQDGNQPTKKGKKRKSISSLPKHRILNETCNCPLRNAIYHPPPHCNYQHNQNTPQKKILKSNFSFCHTFRTPHSLHAYMLHSHTWFSTTSLLIKTTTTTTATTTSQQQNQKPHSSSSTSSTTNNTAAIATHSRSSNRRRSSSKHPRNSSDGSLPAGGRRGGGPREGGRDGGRAGRVGKKAKKGVGR